MTVMPTINGGIKLTPENDKDWAVLKAIAFDAHEELAARLGRLMDEESMWEDIVVPDLKTHFSGQLDHVVKAVNEGKEKDEITIPKEEGELWYGALNQARLGLESKYHFGQEEDIGPDELKEEERQGYLRGRFYCTIQTVLMEYVLEI